MAYYPYKLQDVKEASAKNKFTVISTFAGGGGSSTGYRLAGGKVLCINEFVEEAVNTYRENYPETHILPGDIKELSGKEDIGTGALGLIGNIIWVIVAGIWLCIGHVISGILCFITIIGIPFGIQHFKISGASFAPIGKTVVTKEVAAAALKANAEAKVDDLRK